MENKASIIDPLLEKAAEYAKTSIELLKLRLIEKLSELLSSATFRLIIAITVIIFLILASIGVSLWLGEILGKLYYGFFATSLFYLLLCFCLYVFMRKGVQRFIGNIFIKLFSK